jgi:putative NADH-flavin reductase
MRITVFGATGPTGRQLTGQALTAGHEVTAVTRRPEKLSPRAGLTMARADVTDPEAVEAAVAGSQAVLSALGAPLTRRPVEVYSTGTGHIMAAMHRQGVKRLVVVSSSVTDPRWRPSNAFFFNHVLDPYVNRVLGRAVHEDMRRMEAAIRASELDWTIVRPCGLFDHPDVTGYVTEEDSADGLFTARSDLAAAMLAQLTDGSFVHKAMGVVTTQVRPSIARLIWTETTRKRLFRAPRMAECLYWAPNCTSPRCDAGSFPARGLPVALKATRRRGRGSSWCPRRPGSARRPCSRSGWHRVSAARGRASRRAWRGCRSMPRTATCAGS